MSCATGPVTIVKGESRTLSFSIRNEDQSSRPLNSPDEIVVAFQKDDGSLLEKKLTLSEVTITSDARGEFNVALTAVDTATLKKGDRKPIQVTLTNGTIVRIVPIADALKILEALD